MPHIATSQWLYTIYLNITIVKTKHSVVKCVAYRERAISCLHVCVAEGGTGGGDVGSFSYKPRGELGKYANYPTHLYQLLVQYFELFSGRNPGSRPWTLKIYSRGGKTHLWIAFGNNLEIFPEHTFMNSASVQKESRALALKTSFCVGQQRPLFFRLPKSKWSCCIVNMVKYKVKK